MGQGAGTVGEVHHGRVDAGSRQSVEHTVEHGHLLRREGMVGLVGDGEVAVRPLQA